MFIIFITPSPTSTSTPVPLTPVDLVFISSQSSLDTRNYQKSVWKVFCYWFSGLIDWIFFGWFTVVMAKEEGNVSNISKNNLILLLLLFYLLLLLPMTSVEYCVRLLFLNISNRCYI